MLVRACVHAYCMRAWVCARVYACVRMRVSTRASVRAFARYHLRGFRRGILIERLYACKRSNVWNANALSGLKLLGCTIPETHISQT